SALDEDELPADRALGRHSILSGSIGQAPLIRDRSGQPRDGARAAPAARAPSESASTCTPTRPSAATPEPPRDSPAPPAPLAGHEPRGSARFSSNRRAATWAPCGRRK